MKKHSFNIYIIIAFLMILSGSSFAADCYNIVPFSSKGDYDGLVSLIDAGCDLKDKNFSGERALRNAAENGYLKIVELLLDKGVKVDALNARGDSAIRLASGNGHLDVVKALLESSADPNVKSVEGYEYYRGTALTEASKNGHLEIVKLLLQYDAHVNAGSHYGKTALMYADENQHDDVADLLRQHGGIAKASIVIPVKPEPETVEPETVTAPPEEKPKKKIHCRKIIFYARTGMYKKLNEIIGYCDVNITYANKETALMEATKRGHSEEIELLFKYGADPDIRSIHSGDTALMKAVVRLGRRDIVRALLKHGADPDIQNRNSGDTALMKAVRATRRDTVRILLGYQADPFIKNSKGETALDIAKKKGDKVIIRLLEDAERRWRIRIRR
jgi:ankyrin repeat protein